MHRFAPLLPALTALAAGIVHAHPGDQLHAHPHLEGFVIVLALAVVAGVVWGVRRARRNKPKSK